MVGYIGEGLAGNLLEGHIVEDMAEARCREVHCRRKEYEVVHMVGEGLVNSCSVHHIAHWQVVRIVDSWEPHKIEDRFHKKGL